MSDSELSVNSDVNEGTKANVVSKSDIAEPLSASISRNSPKKKKKEGTGISKKAMEVTERLYKLNKPQVSLEEEVPEMKKLHRKVRSCQEFYDDALKHQQLRHQHIQELRQSIEDNRETYSFKPELCGRSMKIVQNKPYFFERTPSNYLSLFYEEPAKKQFTPKINSRSKRLFRLKSIGSLLYEDAKKRKAQKLETESVNERKINNQSNSLVIHRFIKEFHNLCTEQDANKDGFFNYSRFKIIVQALFHLQESSLIFELWTQLTKGSLLVSKRDLKIGVLAIMGFYFPWMSQSKNQQFKLTQDQAREVHEKYIKFYNKRSISNLEGTHKVLGRYPLKRNERQLFGVNISPITMNSKVSPITWSSVFTPAGATTRNENAKVQKKYSLTNILVRNSSDNIVPIPPDNFDDDELALSPILKPSKTFSFDEGIAKKNVTFLDLNEKTQERQDLNAICESSLISENMTSFISEPSMEPSGKLTRQNSRISNASARIDENPKEISITVYLNEEEQKLLNNSLV